MIDLVIAAQWTGDGKAITISVDPKRVVAITNSMDAPNEKGVMLPTCCIHLDSKGSSSFVVYGSREEVKAKIKG